MRLWPMMSSAYVYIFLFFVPTYRVALVPICLNSPFRPRPTFQFLVMLHHQRSQLNVVDVLVLDIRVEPLLKLLHAQLLTVPESRGRTVCNRLGWDEDIADDLDDAVVRDAIFGHDGGKPVDFDLDETAETGDVDAE